MSNNYNGGGANSSTWGPSSTGSSWLGRTLTFKLTFSYFSSLRNSALSKVLLPDTGGSTGTSYGGGVGGSGSFGVGGGGTSGPPSFNQGSTFAAGPSYGPSFAGDIIRKPSRLTSNENKGWGLDKTMIRMRMGM